MSCLLGSLRILTPIAAVEASGKWHSSGNSRRYKCLPTRGCELQPHRFLRLLLLLLFLFGLTDRREGQRKVLRQLFALIVRGSLAVQSLNAAMNQGAEGHAYYPAGMCICQCF